MFNKLLKLIMYNDIKLSIEIDTHPRIAIILKFSKNNFYMNRIITSLEVADLNCDIGVIVIPALEEFIKEYEYEQKAT